ncbi:hypothetical protein [Mucilaginibacter sp.]|uniref:hypothetical protein n=1 Tax=Mucilaginibacter sp. TaxID=1882438 RepID=UPI0026298A74|nr:hypothetical protein [Mucilaginibacter sp.]
MISDDIFKRRRNHNNTPKPVLLIITNYIVCCALFTLDNKINWFFGLTLILFAIYNYFNIRRNREDYNKVNIIAYIISLLGLVALYFLARKGL